MSQLGYNVGVRGQSEVTMTEIIHIVDITWVSVVTLRILCMTWNCGLPLALTHITCPSASQIQEIPTQGLCPMSSHFSSGLVCSCSLPQCLTGEGILSMG